jgi:hypothetical protein
MDLEDLSRHIEELKFERDDGEELAFLDELKALVDKRLAGLMQ